MITKEGEKIIYLFLRDKLFYGWIIAGSGFIISIIGLGTRYSYGVFLPSIEAEFGITRAATSSIFSVYMLLCCIIAILGGWSVDRYGPKKIGVIIGTFTGLSLLLTSQASSLWQLFITYSLLFSLGTGAIYVVVNSTASRWFVQKRGIVVGITSSGGGLGTIAISPFAMYLISNFNWRTAFIVMGIISWIGITATSLLFKKDPGDIGLLPDNAKPESSQDANPKKAANVPRAGFLLSHAYRMSQFWLLGFSWLFLSLSVHMIFIHIIPYAIAMGVSPMNASFILSLIGVSNLSGRVVLGKLSDTIGRKSTVIACDLIQFGALIWLMWARQLWMLYIFAIIFGLTFGGSSAMITVFIGDIFGTRSLGAIMGILTAGFGLGAAIGPAIGGYIFDVSGQYFAAFVTGSAALLVAACLIALVRKDPDNGG